MVWNTKKGVKTESNEKLSLSFAIIGMINIYDNKISNSH